MPFVSVTRLRLRSRRYLPPFLWHSTKSARQAEHAAGFLDGKLLFEAKNTFWTVTLWEDEAAMRAYRNAASHRAVMPKLIEWCDEASVTHWSQETKAVPDWQEAHRWIAANGRPSKVKYPSIAQSANHITLPEPGRFERRLKPA
ncbi:MAG TPA: DUF3291 domain-containing protein [Blastocatellia bacterium]|nr:DUF3291 domain-containing protein [Blastocatellia bacterium]